DGRFTLNANSSIGPAQRRPFEYRLEPGFLTVEARVPMELRIEIIDGTGRTQGGLTRHLEAGDSRIALAGAMPASSRPAGLYFLRLRLGRQTVTHPFFNSGSGASGTVFAP